ncbi:hypothetical protein ACFQ4N_10520 [Oceanobacillus iheyensis]|uniref:Hypothetical conserved protein n=1 Tax=Oceanobacillus iheyensis (strain DSM 14371 / CIP 107618 / JCM 11309 / KCTC 3954 / HTE831) TaxID=221109 RepID=Q8ER86_OCEIH|nr:hypothetical protein [Oceanobacillus iheyensis]BAC13382.1 hypothetical conserved protein [Oceanobacillus iheyensis HTE831]
MKKRYVLSAVGAVGAGIASYYLVDSNNRQKLKDMAKNSAKNVNRVFENAGVPDQSSEQELDQLENSKMVSEGSQFGVQYYNENKNENSSEQQQNTN